MGSKPLKSEIVPERNSEQPQVWRVRKQDVLNHIQASAKPRWMEPADSLTRTTSRAGITANSFVRSMWMIHSSNVAYLSKLDIVALSIVLLMQVVFIPLI